MELSIDVVIASFRLDEKYILPLLRLQRPISSSVKFYIIADNPAIIPSANISALINNDSTFLIINSENLGASASRNKGLEAGEGDWILFLDDDIIVPNNLLLVYETAIRQHTNEIGFIGLVNFPPPPTRFTQALIESGAMSIFSIAENEGHHAWGASANFAVNRKTIGNAKFSTLFPKSGGGEDVDFFFQIREQNKLKNFKLLPQAAVTHPWWANGQRQFKRFLRYGSGNALLPKRFPSFRYFDFPNIAEISIISMLVFLVACITNFISPAMVSVFLISSLIFEFLFTWVDNWIINKNASIAIAVDIFLIQCASYTGYLLADWITYRKPMLFERFNFSGLPRKSFQLNRRKIMKGLFYTTAIIIIIAIK